jgi:radical SAM superfamily enzyme YgiQ (UPF0313 family)
MMLEARYVDLSTRDTTYTSRYIPTLMERAGITLSDESHVIFATVSDAMAFSSLRALRRKNPHATIVAGGYEAYNGEWMLAFADAVVVGKGERFIAQAGEQGELPMDLPEVFTRDTIEARATVPYENSNLYDYPLIQTKRALYYAVASFGCKGKCAFCGTSWVQPYRRVSDAHAQKLCEMAKEKRITLITNDFDMWRGHNINVQSMRVQDVLQSARAREALDRATGYSLVRFGVEGFTEAMRRKLGKPVSNEDLKLVFRILQDYNVKCQVFLIAGIPGDGELDNLLAFIEPSLASRPEIRLKFTTLNPNPHTPLWTMNLWDIGEITEAQLKKWRDEKVLKLSRRVRVLPFGTAARELWRAMLRRCQYHEVEILGSPPKARSSKDEYLREVERKGMGHLIDVTLSDAPLANSHIVTPYRDSLAKAAGKWGLSAQVLRDVD